MKKYFAFYGTLREGQYNCERCLTDRTTKKYKSGIEFIENVTITQVPWKLISLGSYPMLLPVDHHNFPLVVDIFEIDNYEVERFIQLMEEGAGYSKHLLPVYSKKMGMVIECEIWVGDKESTKYYKKRPIIISGDWVGYNSESNLINDY